MRKGEDDVTVKDQLFSSHVNGRIEQKVRSFPRQGCVSLAWTVASACCEIGKSAYRGTR